MASVTSLDKDLRKMRLDKYTPGAAREVREWIEDVLRERLPPGDLLEALKDGVALCRLVNLAIPPPGVKFKQSSMPFVQMENVSHFLRACQQPPLNLQQHDMFLTVDLYESKDPAQVLQCLGAFSRAANAAKPSVFQSAIGRGRGVLSPQSTGPPARNRGTSNASNGSSAYGATPVTGSGTGTGRWSPSKPSSPSISSWSRREHEGATSPAWNIAQYGYMGGASQGNLGISFGGRRQITAEGPSVPSLAEKEKLRREQEELQRQQMEEEERRRRAEREAEEERARQEEERRVEEARKAREAEKRKWQAEEERWQLEKERRRKEEEEAEARLAEERQRSRNKSDGRLHGQFLSQYQAEQGVRSPPHLKQQRTGEKGGDGYRDRVKELEKELELARQREQDYERERQERTSRSKGGVPDSPVAVAKTRARSRSRPAAPRPISRQDSWSRDEREYLRTAWNSEQEQQQQLAPPEQKKSPLVGRPQPALPPRPLPDPTLSASTSAASIPPPPSPGKVKTHRTGEGPPAKPVKPQNTGGSSRPLPDPRAYVNRTDQFLAMHSAPAPVEAQQTYSREIGSSTAERDAEDRRRNAAQQQTKAGGWASKSLLEREMELERQRQREWEDAQKETAKAVRPADGGVDGVGGGIGGRWDVNQWTGYTGGDGQNRGTQGIGANRRQIVGPRPLPGSGR